MKRQPALIDVDTDQQENGVETFVDVDKDSGGAPGHQFARRRQRAVQRLRPAPGGDHLRRAEPVPRDHGRGAAVHAQPRGAEGRLRAGARHRRRGDRPPAAGSIDQRRPATATDATTAHARPRRLGQSRPCATRPPARREHRADHAWCRCRPSRSFAERPTATSVNHQDAELATTISYNLAEGGTLADGQAAVRAGRGRDRHADQRARQLPGHGARRRRNRSRQQPLLILRGASS